MIRFRTRRLAAGCKTKWTRLEVMRGAQLALARGCVCGCLSLMLLINTVGDALSYQLAKLCFLQRIKRSSFAMSSRQIEVFDLSTSNIGYSQGLNLQTAMFERVDYMRSLGLTKLNQAPIGELLLLQHAPTYTTGSGTRVTSGPFSTKNPDGSPLDFVIFKADRAGDITYHGPGQVVMYPVVDLNNFGNDIHWYLRALEDVAIGTAKTFGIAAQRMKRPGYTGVWVGTAKVAAIGLKVSRWITTHGMSVNVAPDMRYFANIVPCGISDADKSVGALADFCPGLTVPDVTAELTRQFCLVMGAEVSKYSTGKQALAQIQRRKEG